MAGLLDGTALSKQSRGMYKIIGADGKEYGHVTADQLRTWIAENRANAQTRVLPEGATEWKTLADLPEFVSLLGVAMPGTPATISLGVPQMAKTNSMAVTGLIMGILSITCCVICIGLPCNVLGIIFSAIGLSQIQKNPATQKGKGMAITGLVLCLLSFVVWIILRFTLPWSYIMQKAQEIQQQQ